MNKIINKFFIEWRKIYAKLHLKQTGFINSSCGPFTKQQERIQKFRKTGHLKRLYRNELDKDYFAHDAAYSDSKDWTKGTTSDKILQNRADEIARNRNYDEYQRALARMVYECFDEKTGLGVSANGELVEELHKPIIKNSKRREAYARFTGNIWVADLAEMESLSK